MGTVTAYNLNNIQAALGGSNPIGLNEYYRGGAYVPTSRITSGREPATGQYFNPSNTSGGSVNPTYPYFSFEQGGLFNNTGIFWGFNGSTDPYTGLLYTVEGTTTITSYTAPDGYTYYRGTLGFSISSKLFSSFYYGVYREGSSTVSINTGVPSSGTISIANLYGAQNP